MTSEDTELGALTPTLEGCLGKFQERTSSLEVCPWCSSKGLVHALCSYPINFQETITLCTNPQCLFPLVSRPLEDILGELLPVPKQPGGKRKNSHVFQSEDAPVPPLKRLRSHEDELALDIADPPVPEATPLAISVDAMEGILLRDTTCERAGPGGAHPLEGLTPSQAACQGHGVRAQSDPLLVPTRCPSEPSAGETPFALASPLSSEGVHGALTSPVFTSDLASKVMDQTPGDILFRQADGWFHQGLPPLNLDPDQYGEPVEEPADKRLLPSPLAHERIAREPWFLEGNLTSTPTLGTTNQVEPEAPPTTPEPLNPKTAPVGVLPSPTETVPLKEAGKLVSLPEKMFWWNTDKLCWLDTLLVALVNCKSLRNHGPADRTRKSPTWDLIARYDEICAEVQAQQQTGKDGVVRVPEEVLQNAYSKLQSIRLSVFKLLQPKLKCRLGRQETPVFALPVLVAGDPWAESLFEQSFLWEFECSSCQNVSKTRVTKPLPTFTSLASDWHPERATHPAPCNMCHRKDQQRTMVLDSVPPVFALHFVEGLPDGDLEAYAFSHRGRRYAVSTVIQYDHTVKHFVTWTRTPDGTWQEFDDLKHPACSVHATLPVPPQEMHIVFWEEDYGLPRPGCAPGTAATETLPPSGHTPGLPATPLLDEGDMAGALSVSTDGSFSQDAAADLDVSIGSAMLLDTFEGLSHSDIITLTLVEVKDDPPGPPMVAGAPAPAPAPEPEPTLADLSRVTSSSPPLEVLSDPDSHDDVSGDPTFVPGSGKPKRKRQTQAKAKSSDGPAEKKPRAAPKSRAAPRGSKKGVPAPVVPAAVTVETQPLAAPAPLPAVKPAHQDSWTYLLSRHVKATPTPITTPAPVTPAPKENPAKPAPLAASRGPAQQFVKPPLRLKTDELSHRHAGTYDGFGVIAGETTAAPAPPRSPAPLPRAKPYALLLPPGATQLPAASAPLGKRDRPPEALGTTDALRLKLLKKLKAKKKKLDALNRLLLQNGGAPHPDSTGQTSPQAVTSSTASNPQSKLFLDWLSPASTASNLSPDSSGLPEAPVTAPLDPVAADLQAACRPCKLTSSGENLLEELLSGMGPGQPQPEEPTQMETQDVSALDAGSTPMCAMTTEFDSFDMADFYMFGV